MNSYAGAVRDQLDRLFHRGTVAGLGEAALLRRYVVERDEAAFAALVARHGPMVLGVCRRILRDERDVEDAFQATFLVLVRRDGAIRDGDLVGRWLYGVARRVAVRARAHSARRFVHEQSVDGPIEPETALSVSRDAERRELATIVDEEVARLPSALRDPVVLCYLEGMSHDEAADRLRWPVGTVRSRMARARELLRHRLARRGVTAEGTAIAAALVRLPVPHEWLDATVRISLEFATRHATAAAAIASARPVAIARRVIQTMVITKLTYIGAAGLGIALAFGGVRTLAFQGRGEAKTAATATVIEQGPGEPVQPPVPPMPTPMDSSADEGNRRVAAAVFQIGEDLDRTMRQLADLQERLRRIEAELEPGPRGRPKSASEAALKAAAAAPEAKKDDEAGDPERPQYIGLGQSIIVISPDGARAAVLDPRINKTKSLKLPAMYGVRREFIVPENNSFEVPGRSGQRLEFRQAHRPWLTALELDGERNVVQILAFNVVDGDSAGILLPKPYVARSSFTVSRPDVICVGHRIYAFSTTAKRWGVLSLAPGIAANPTFQNGATWAEKNGRLFRFNVETGEWEDLYARALEGVYNLKYEVDSLSRPKANDSLLLSRQVLVALMSR